MATLVELSITNEDVFSDSLALHAHFNLSLSGTWGGIVTIQRSFDNGVIWRDVGTFTSNTEEYGFEPGHNVLYKIGIKAGQFTFGQVDIRMGK